MVSKEQKDYLVLTIVSLSRCREIGSKAFQEAECNNGIEGSVWEGLMVDLKLEILSIKNLKKLSHRASEAVRIVLTRGFTTELITENKTLGLSDFPWLD